MHRKLFVLKFKWQPRARSEILNRARKGKKENVAYQFMSLTKDCCLGKVSILRSTGCGINSATLGVLVHISPNIGRKYLYLVAFDYPSNFAYGILCNHVEVAQTNNKWATNKTPSVAELMPHPVHAAAAHKVATVSKFSGVAELYVRGQGYHMTRVTISNRPKTFSAENYRPKIIGWIFGRNEYSASAAENEKSLTFSNFPFQSFFWVSQPIFF
jgi:hypothetical protein